MVTFTTEELDGDYLGFDTLGVFCAYQKNNKLTH